MAHTCHAAGCNKHVPPEMFMCRRHWFLLPKPMRDDIWGAYRQGQCDDWGISHDYAEAARVAIKYLAEKEGVSGESLRESIMVYDMLDPGGSD